GPKHYERRQVGVGLDCQTHLSAGRPIKHPCWNLQPTVRVGCGQVAAKDNTARPLNCLMNADPQAGPWIHGYSSSRNSVLWAFSSLVVQRGSPAQGSRISFTP